MKLDLDEATMRGLVSEAILRGIDDKARDSIVAQALEHLLKEPTGSYGQRHTSPITNAFNEAVREIAFKVVKDMVADDPAIRTKVAELAARVFVTALESDLLVRKMADAMVTAVVIGRE